MTKRKFYKNTITITILTEDTPYEFKSLEGVAYDMNYGDCVGDVDSQEPIMLDGKQTADFLYDIGCQPEFFFLDDDGNDSDDDNDVQSLLDNGHDVQSLLDNGHFP